jgi:hypothetical protein
MKLIDLPAPYVIPEVEQLAINELIFINSSLARRVEEHKMKYKAFWQNYSHTPDSILAAMGTNASIWLAAAAESMDHIGRLAAIVGKTINDFIPPEMYVPPRAFIINPDFTVSLAPPAAGFDAWGRVLFTYQEPIPEEPIPQDPPPEEPPPQDPPPQDPPPEEPPPEEPAPQ